MSVEAQEFRKVMDDINPHVGLANLWEYLPVMRWLDVSGIKNKLRAAVTRRDAFLQRLIDAERRKLDDGGSEDGDKSMIAVMFTLQKKEPNVYTDTMIRGLCTVSSSILRHGQSQLHSSYCSCPLNPNLAGSEVSPI
jgi:hypothetical protein